MLPSLIKAQFGRTIDKSRLVNDPCPKCGGPVYRVLENNDEAFCVKAFCNFHSYIDHSLYNTFIEKIEYDVDYRSQPCKFVDAAEEHVSKELITFNRNSRYPGCTLPVMFVDDFKKGEFVIYDLKLNEAYWNSIPDYVKRYCGMTRNHFYDLNSQAIARYYNLQHLVESGWTPNHDIKI